MAKLTNTIIEGTLQVEQGVSISGSLEVIGSITASGNNILDNYQALGSKNTDFTIDCDLGSVISFTLAGDLSLTLNANAVSDKAREIKLIITKQSNYNITWPDSVMWPNSTAPVLTSDKINILTLLTVDNGTTWYGFTNGLNF